MPYVHNDDRMDLQHEYARRAWWLATLEANKTRQLAIDLLRRIDRQSKQDRNAKNTTRKVS